MFIWLMRSMYNTDFPNFAVHEPIIVRVAERSKAPDSRIQIFHQVQWSILVHECGHGFESHPWQSQTVSLIGINSLMYCFKEMSTEPDLNQWPKDLRIWLTTTVLRSTNWAIGGWIVQQLFYSRIGATIPLWQTDPFLTLKLNCM